jgi:hypothetical protein
MVESDGIVVAQGFASSVGVLKTEPNSLDDLVSQGAGDGCLALRV